MMNVPNRGVSVSTVARITSAAKSGPVIAIPKNRSTCPTSRTLVSVEALVSLEVPEVVFMLLISFTI
jgi:hypothetical protein